MARTAKPGPAKKTTKKKAAPKKRKSGAKPVSKKQRLQIQKLSKNYTAAEVGEFMGLHEDTVLKYGDFSGSPAGPGLKMEWTDKELDQLENMIAIGLTVEECCHIFGICTSTLYRHNKDFEPGIMQRINRGRSNGNMKSSVALIRQVERGNVSAIKWFEMTRYNRAEKQETTNQNFVVEAPKESETDDDWESEFGNAAE